jgi:hypothetical protein
MKNKTIYIIAPLIVGLILILLNPESARSVEEGCNAPYNLTHHGDTGKLDICTIEHTLGYFKVLTNWGTKPEWLNERQFVFLSNQISDVYLMDIEKNTVRNLTGQFTHAGYTRAHRLNTGDLLLVGPVSGPQPPDDPLVIYDKGQFNGSMWVFESPFDRPPYLLKMKTTSGRMTPIPAWEGIAVSKESNRIVWSDTRTPFFGGTIIQTGWNYFFKRSNLWIGKFVHRPGASYMDKSRKIVSKYTIGPVFLEPQNFIGRDDKYVSFSAYGPSSTGSGNTFLYDVKEDRVIRTHIGKGYEEWEGVAPDYQKSFVENEADASRFIGPQAVELYLHDFATHQTTRFSFFQDDHQREDGFYLHEPVFSPDGTHALFATGGGGGWEINSPGYGIGIVLLDVEDYLESID